MKVKYIIHILLISFVLVSCHKEPIYFTNLEKIDGLDQSLFNVKSITLSDADQRVIEYHQTKATSTNLTSYLQNILESYYGPAVLEIVGTYTSTNIRGERITLSGKVIIPTAVKAERYILTSHYTIGSDQEAPSNSFPLEGSIAKQGYIMVFPDYEGYGVTASHPHPYLALEQSANNIIDMMIAVQKLLANTKYAPAKDDIFLMGYSQGAANTMATEYYIEKYRPELKVRGAIVGGGPYDILATYQTCINNDFCGIPYAIPLILQSMIYANNLDIDIRDMLQGNVADNYDKWINSKKYTTKQVNTLIGTKQLSNILSPKAMTQDSHEVAELYKAMSENSILSYEWTPSVPVYMFHSMDDDTVPYINATKAKSRWKDGNIQYNFGHYGGHVMGAVRFILTAKTFFESQKLEDKKNEKS
jgi:predicted esterase